jgi:hypothetical protein
MPKQPPPHEAVLATEDALQGFSAIALHFWRTAERLRSEAEKATAGRRLREDWNVLSAVCLYHVALDCFINEEITIYTSRLPPIPENSAELTQGYRVQGNTLNAKKIEDFLLFFGLTDQISVDVRRRAEMLAGLRNRLAHHWPVLGLMGNYPSDVVAALKDAQIELINTSWTAQCSDVRLGRWAANVVRGFVDEWWRLGRQPAEIERRHWDYGPDWHYPEPSEAAPA